MRGAKRIALTAVVVLLSSSTLWGQSRIPWVSSWAEASALAQRHQRLILIHFLSNNCPPCVKLERSVFNRPEFIRSLTSSYVPLQVNVDENAELATHYQVDRWPTDVIVTAQGVEVYRGASPLDVNRYIATLDQVAAHTRIGAPFQGAPNTDIAMTSPGSIPGREVLNRASAFTVDASSASQGQYAAPSLPGGMPYGAAPPQQNQFPVGVAQSGSVTPAPTSQPGRPLSAPSFVMNQYTAGEPAQAPPGPQPAEQRVSYTAPYGGEFQPSAGPSNVSQAAQSTQAPQTSMNPYATGAPQQPVSVMPSSSGMPNVPTNPAFPPFEAKPYYTSRAPQQPQLSIEAPTKPSGLAMDGYCSVTLVEQENWAKGDPKYGAVHRGRTYLFTGPEEQQRFLADYDKYAPALSGYDCVKYSQQGALVDGSRAHGVFYRGQIYLFADEAALQTFWASPERFVPSVRAEEQRQATRPNDARR